MTDQTRRSLLGRAGAGLAAALAGAPREAHAAPLALRRGVNAWPWFSLTTEYPAPRTDYAWPPFQSGRPVPRASDLRRLRAAGFDFIRLPVDPGPFLAFDDRRRRDLLDMLLTAVGGALAEGLAVVVNIQANEATHHWNSALTIAGLDAAAFPAYRALVAEIARDLASLRDARLALEPVNEPPQLCGSPGWPPVQMALLGATRAAAPDLTLVATGSCGSMIPGLQALDPAPVLALAPILLTFHYYEPYLFTHQGAPWMREPVYRSLNAVPWPASAGTLAGTLAAVRRRQEADTATSPEAKQAAYRETERVLQVYFDAKPDSWVVDKAFAQVRAWAGSHGIAPDRILLGEFGALRTDSRYVAAPAPDRARYIRDVRVSAERAGFPWAFWNLFDGMGLMDDTTRAFDPDILGALGLGG